MDSLYLSGAELRRKNARLRSERMAAARVKGRHTAEEWAALKEEFGHRCVRCLVDGEPLQRGHITPIYQGGSDGIENIQPLCRRCNASKGPETTNWVERRRNG